MCLLDVLNRSGIFLLSLFFGDIIRKKFKYNSLDAFRMVLN